MAKPEEAPRIRVLVVDDRPIFRMGARGMLALDPGIELVGEAADGMEALEKARILHPDVILMDVEMPRMNGVEATEAITGEMANVSVVALTLSDDHDDVIRMVAAGATGYLLKDAGPTELAGAVREAFAGRIALDPKVGREVLRKLGRAANRRLASTEITVALTPRERQLLRLLATGAPNKELARELGTSEATVKVQLKGLYDKLGVNSRSAAAALAGSMEI